MKNPTKKIMARSLDMIASSLWSENFSFREFINQAWPILEPNNKFIDSWYIDLICEHLQLVTTGEIKKLLINVPPRTGKSSLITILWPVWSWTQKPWLRFIFCSYSASLSVKHSIDRRRIIESDWFKMNWGNTVRLAEDQNQKNEYENSMRGRMFSTSVGGTLTGKGGDVLVEDDMLNPQKAESAADRAHMLSMHKNVLSSRLDNPKTGLRVIVEQRTHHMDLSAHILKNESGWTHLNLPMRAPERSVVIFPVSRKTMIRDEHELLCPARIGETEVVDMKKTMGTRTFNAQCQQLPTAEEGNIFRRNWWKFWKEKPAGAEVTIQSWDMSFKETKSGSFVVGQIWKKRGADFYLIDQFRARVDFTDTVNALLGLTSKHIEAKGKLIEDAANGPAIMSALGGKVAGIIPIPACRSKIARAQAVAPLVESGHVYLPDPELNSWVYDYIEELAAFRGSRDEINDQVDATSQALAWMHDLNYHVPEMDMEEGSFVDGDMAVAGGFR